MSVSKRLRFQIFKRDEFTCQYCGRNPPDVVLNVDHIVPISRDGSDDPTNLVTSCWDCNIGKSDIPLNSIPKSLKDQAKEIAERREQMDAYGKLLMEIRNQEIDDVNNLAAFWFSLKSGKPDNEKYVFSEMSRNANLRRFIRNLPVSIIMEAMESAHIKVPSAFDSYRDDDSWRYFCKICWNKIKRR